ncbi:hypothetical protein PH5382_03871 [Phaeobacter sp. CECT 5382]|nr:hypothetical protein PH5382_03871 [Phaeobacter sp. CECT 5382]
MFDAGRTHVDCEFANHAVSGGYFDKIDNPTITGTCPKATRTAAPQPVIGAPVVPLGPPIAPWCDCTDEEWQGVLSLMTGQNVLINPGYGSANPVADWAKAFGTDTATIETPDFWANGQVPAFNELSGRRFLKLK